ncbi:MAG: hypothetical protein Q7W53_05910 [Pseudomonadota bacterium]|nr:hypothetical protein [Pseudomonadota bacterium]
MIRFFRHYISVSMLFLMVLEFLVFFFASDFSAERHGSTLPLSRPETTLFKPWLFAAVLTLLSSMFDLYGWAWTTGLRSLFLRVAGCFAISG